jgi:hypothetical protein
MPEHHNESMPLGPCVGLDDIIALYAMKRQVCDLSNWVFDLDMMG